MVYLTFELTVLAFCEIKFGSSWGGVLMFVMVLVTCITLESQTVCHEFPRGHQFSSLSSCKTASAIERGRYRSRIAERKWANYDWNCIARDAIADANLPAKIALDETSIRID